MFSKELKALRCENRIAHLSKKGMQNEKLIHKALRNQRKYSK